MCALGKVAENWEKHVTSPLPLCGRRQQLTPDGKASRPTAGSLSPPIAYPAPSSRGGTASPGSCWETSSQSQALACVDWVASSPFVRCHSWWTVRWAAWQCRHGVQWRHESCAHGILQWRAGKLPGWARALLRLCASATSLELKWQFNEPLLP